MEGWENWRFANDFGYFHTKKYFEYQEIYATLILHDKIKESGDWSMSGLFRALHRTKVFRNLTEQEFAWVLYDVGNSAFIMLACSLIPIWFKSLAQGREKSVRIRRRRIIRLPFQLLRWWWH